MAASVLAIAGVIVEAKLRLPVAVVLLALLVQPVNIVIEVLLQGLVFVLPRASLAVLLAMLALVRVLQEANLPLRTPSTHLVLAAQDAFEDGAPFEVEESDEH